MRHVFVAGLLMAGCSSGDDDDVADATGETGGTTEAADSGAETGSTSNADPTNGPGDGDGDGDGDTSNDSGASCTRDGTCIRIVFITDEAFTGDLGGLGGADAKCQAEAAAARLPGTYRAWLSDETTSAADHVALLASTDPLVRADERPLVDSGAMLVGGAELQNAIRIGAAGTAVVALDAADSPCSSQTKGAAVWTGTNVDGTSKNATCNGWTEGSASASAAGVGDFNARTHGRWTDTCNAASCDRLARLYCIQQP